MLTFERDSNFSFKSNDSRISDDDNNLIVKAKQILEIVTNKKITAKIFLNKLFLLAQEWVAEVQTQQLHLYA